jgi:hypothetical protein
MQVYRFVLFFLLLLMHHVSARSQITVFGSEWTKGRILLTDSDADTLQGTIRFELENNVVQIYYNDNTVKTYAARQFKWLKAYDPSSKTEREYYALPYALRNSYKVPVLFEMLAEGTISLLGREKLILVQNTWMGGARFSHPELVYDFYLGFPDGKIKPYRGTRKDFEYLLKGQMDLMRNFIKEAGLSYNRKQDLVRIINQYNYLNYKDKILKND